MTKRPSLANVPTERLVPGQEYRVLSVHPEWAWAIIFAGKDVENRSWETPHRGPLLIHASGHKSSAIELTMARSEIAAISGLPLSRIPADFPRSTIIGIVDLVGCVDDSRSKWASPHDLHWLMRFPRALETPVHGILGKLKLWRWTAGPTDASGRHELRAGIQQEAVSPRASQPSSAHEVTAAPTGLARPGRTVDEIDADEVVGALRELASSTPINDVELLRSVSRKLGFARMGARVEAGLRAHVRRAVRRGVLIREGKTLRRA